MKEVIVDSVEQREFTRNIHDDDMKTVVSGGDTVIKNDGDIIALLVTDIYDDIDIADEISFLCNYDFNDGPYTNMSEASIRRDVADFADDTCSKLLVTGSMNEEIPYNMEHIIRGGACAYRRALPNKWQNIELAFEEDIATPLIDGCPFTLIVLNKNVNASLHKDDMISTEPFISMPYFKVGDFSGGNLSFPYYSLLLELEHGDIVVMNGQYRHTSTVIDGATSGDFRITAPMAYWTSEELADISNT